MNLETDNRFKSLLNRYLPGKISKETISKTYDDFIEESKVDREFQLLILNAVKACLISGTVLYSDLEKKVIEYIDDDAPSTIHLIFLTICIFIGEDTLAVLNRLKRDFITEVIAKKYNVDKDEVTSEMRSVVLDSPGAVYSIEDKPIEDWDKYFFNICRQVARNSKCLSRRIGAVLVKDKSVISTGYNGPPRGIPRCDRRWELDLKFKNKYFSKLKDNTNLIGKCPRYPLGAKSGQMLNICVAAHAEENSILDAARRGVKVKGATMYMTCGIPCTQCLIKIINAGIKEIVVTGITFYDENAEWLLNNSDVKVRLYDF